MPPKRELNWQDVLNSLLFWTAIALFMVQP